MTELQLDATPEERHIFVAEAYELLHGLEEQLVRLEQAGPTPELLQEIFRVAHTIKGSSAAIAHDRMAQLTHALETLLDRLRQGRLAITPPLINQLFEALDLLRALTLEVENLRQTDTDVTALAQTLDSWAAANEERPQVAPTVRGPALVPPSGATHHILVRFEAEEWGAVRALQSLLVLDGLADEVVSRPSRQELEDQRTHNRLEAWVRSEQSADAIREALESTPETVVLSIEAVDDDIGDPIGVEAAPDARVTTSVGASEGAAGAGPAAGTVRIDVERLDRLLELVGELVVDRTVLWELVRGLSEEDGKLALALQLAEATAHLGRVTEDLQTEVMKSRMLPISTVLGRFRRVVRDVASRQEKRVELTIEGQETELDRSVIEAIVDPLVQLLRNAIDHGVEPPAARAASGKPETATLRLAAMHVENSIVIVVEDDGRGVDVECVRQTAIERGVIAADAAARLSDAEALDLIFAPGFSTAAQVSDVSGRGVGLDIVRANVERLGGSVGVQTKAGEGAQFVLRLPLTLAIVRALLVGVGNVVCAVPVASVTEVLRVESSAIQRVHHHGAMLLRGAVVPVVRMSDVFGSSGRASAGHLVVSVQIGERLLGLVVDRVLGEQEVVIRSMGSLVGQVAGISSAAILGDGTVCLVVDVPGLVHHFAADRHERGGEWSYARSEASEDQALARAG